MQNQLPTELDELTLHDLPQDQTAYVVPWAIRVDQTGAMWICTLYHYKTEPYGTAATKIVRKGETIRVFRQTLPTDELYLRPMPVQENLPTFPVELV